MASFWGKHEGLNTQYCHKSWVKKREQKKPHTQKRFQEKSENSAEARREVPASWSTKSTLVGCI